MKKIVLVIVMSLLSSQLMAKVIVDSSQNLMWQENGDSKWTKGTCKL
ncbi:MAG: hypothetical protein U9P72_09785 [Campylobacterota bacterium]|nr:hypothetical protein [Campylobacterota bacterium]